MTGTRRAAIALMSLDQITASKIMANLPRECAVGVSAEIGHLGKVPRTEMQEVERQFLKEVAALLCTWTHEAGGGK